MSDEHEDLPSSDSAIQPTVDTSRRRFLGGAAVLGVGATLSACGNTSEAPSPPVTRPLTPQELDKALREQVKTVVVIYAENRSFNNLFADFPGVEQPLSALTAKDFQQRDRDGSVLPALPPSWGGVLQVGPQTVDGVTYPSEVQFQQNLPNAPFALKGPQGEDLPLSLVTRDLWHVFYQNQMQINGGKNDGFVAWGDSGGLVMGHYAQSRYALRLWDVAKEFVLCDNFFQGAFGGSFLNHQYLISATAPFYPNAAQSVAKAQIATLQSDDPRGTRLKPLDTSPASAMTGPPQFGPSALTPDGYGVNTLAPPYWPTWIRDPQNPDYSKPDLPNVLVPQTHEHIGDKLSKKNIDWAWYAGAWQATLEQFKDSGGIPKIPNFQYHHQPFNYFKQQGPQNPAERAKRLRDGGLGDESSTNRFFADAQSGKLPAVSFYKPQGNLNMHAGYADVASGDRHIARALKVLQESPQWKNMVVVVTVDENGGWWDHVAPPQGDRWGPGSRVPALVVSPFARKGTVDHTVYDTASILRLITRVFQLETLDGLKQRDDAMIARGQKPMGDLSNALQFSL
ncbi:MAG: acid phosphatase [Pseudomonadales bacterium RIFCSPLOWO2_12_60_38]|uniref:acid phosphatase n=3 Tax=Pseudomonas TaxID=286 RepID=UPI0003DC1E82|nr:MULTISPECIES: acid phosphatase [unclassified Pseudomonas]ETK42545.1 acid phosphatase [Pseudomonas fluorescens FH5]MBJ2238437.1 acid phosphatase [Pseudomonas fluorescens]MDN5421567.1 acid phosphatase [Pseudomonadales bacterium]MDN5595836.1 acid phosphatase [Pseudomonas sp.]OHC34395.1 MAG: acid phosphatase [Pseudomonadales bacterium RIFCSPLOWO2_12_60_38]OHC40866.1 MAG: acid phosphatase [Pseudomonadales bacterium RIFCSPLOWO2_12_FULL_59_450]